MQSFLIVSGSREARLEEAKERAKDSSQFDLTVMEADSLGIGDVRKLIHTLSLKPVSSLKKYAILSEAQSLTIEAQNALLKTLEEPPPSAVIILTSPNKELLLPTIVSRCEVIELLTNTEEFTSENSELITHHLSLITTGTLGARLKLAQDVSKSKEEAIVWLEQSIYGMRKKLIDVVSNNNTNNSNNATIASLLNCLIVFQKTHTIIKTTNANLRVTIEHLLLNL